MDMGFASDKIATIVDMGEVSSKIGETDVNALPDDREIIFGDPDKFQVGDIDIP